MSNEMLLGGNKSPGADRSYKILMSNCLLVGRSLSKVPDDACLAEHLKESERYELIQQVTKNFFDRWSVKVNTESVFAKSGTRHRNIQR